MRRAARRRKRATVLPDQVDWPTLERKDEVDGPIAEDFTGQVNALKGLDVSSLRREMWHAHTLSRGPLPRPGPGMIDRPGSSGEPRLRALSALRRRVTHPR